MTAEVSPNTEQTTQAQGVRESELSQFELGDELRVLVTKLVNEHLAVQPTRDSETIELLKLSQQSLKDSHEAMRTKLDKEWDIPKNVFTYIALGATVFFGINLFQQYAATSNFNSQTEALRKQSDDVDEQFTLFKSFESEYHAQVERDQMRRASSLRILALLDVARDQLIHQKNYDRALHYADEAGKELESLKRIQEPKSSEGDYKVAGGLARMCSQLDGAISLIQAESYFQRGRPQDLNQLRVTASRVVDSGCGCLEGHYFLGLCSLLESEHRQNNEATAAKHEAVVELQKAIGKEGRSNLASVFLGAVHLELGNTDAAIANAENFLEDFPPSIDGRRRLSPDTQARIWAASIVKELAAFVRSPSRIADDSGCSVDVGAIGLSESAVLERLFLRLARKKNILFRDGRQSDQFGHACLRSATLLQSVSCGVAVNCPDGNCGSPNDFVSPLLLSEYGVIPRVDLPPVSRDLRLGMPQQNGDTMMLVQKAVIETQVVTMIDEDDVETELTYQIESAQFVPVVVKYGKEVPADHYVKYPRAVAAPAAAAPAAAEIAPARR
jgi:tetratricopeptide (TPR) repeat protein